MVSTAKCSKGGSFLLAGVLNVQFYLPQTTYTNLKLILSMTNINVSPCYYLKIKSKTC